MHHFIPSPHSTAEKKDFGFVLKRFLPDKQTILVLGYAAGKVALTIQDLEICRRLWPGMLISFFSHHEKQSLIGREVKIEMVLSPHTAEDHLWISHLIELCLFFTAFNQPWPEVFEHLAQCFTLLKHEEDIAPYQLTLKKVYILKFLSLMGSYSFKSIEPYLKLFQDATSCFIDFTNLQKVNFLKERLHGVSIKKLDNWILQALQEHPCFNQLKTPAQMYARKAL